MTKHADLFTPRQLVALTTFSDLVGEARERATQDALAAGLTDDDVPLNDGGTGARAYGEAISVYLAFAVDRLADFNSTSCGWIPVVQATRNTFGRQALPMTWDYAELNPFGDWLANYNACLDKIIKPIDVSIHPVVLHGNLHQTFTSQHDATTPPPPPRHHPQTHLHRSTLLFSRSLRRSF